jgi:hypothetical protein
MSPAQSENGQTLSGPFVDTEKKGISLQLLGEKMHKDGIKAHVIEVKRTGYDPERHFIRVDNHLLARIEKKTFNSEKSLWEDDATDYEDYRTVNGVKLPFVIREKEIDKLTVNNYKINAPIDPAVFK